MQSDSLGVGREFLEEKQLAWVLSFWQIVIDRRPAQNEAVKVGTFPYDFKGFMGLRNFLIEDDNGQHIVSANSIWTLLDMKNGRPVKATEEITEHYTVEERLPMEYAGRKVAIPEDGNILAPVRVTREYIDTNHHMNNARYITVAMNYIPCHLEVKEIRIEYKKQAFLGDVMYPFLASIEGGVAISLRDEDGNPYVNMHILTIPGGEVL
jgi:acyl-ACP thioesterase